MDQQAQLQASQRTPKPIARHVLKRDDKSTYIKVVEGSQYKAT